MKEDIKNKWVEALRSGKYEQGSGLLRDTNETVDKFCCLGVLCDISEKGEWITDLCGDVCYKVLDEPPSSSVLPESIKQWANMISKVGLFDTSDKGTLTLQNDTGKSFNEIADIIEEYWEEL
jgi:hypothetical protein